MPWIVKIVKPINPIDDPFTYGFFPRTYYYKKDAEAMAEQVKGYGGNAKVEKKVKTQRKKE